MSCLRFADETGGLAGPPRGRLDQLDEVAFRVLDVGEPSARLHRVGRRPHRQTACRHDGRERGVEVADRDRPVPEPQRARGIQRVGVGAITAGTGPFDQFQPHTGTRPQHHGAHGRLGQLELLDDLTQTQCLLVPGTLHIEIRHGQAGVVHVQPQVDIGHDDLHETKVSGTYQVSGTNLSVMPENVKRASGHHHGDLRHALENAALELVAAKGVGGFTMAEAGRRAGVSVAAPYKHYPDRDTLLTALAVRAYTHQRQRYRAAMAEHTEPGAQLAAFATAYVQFAADQPALFELTFAAGLNKARFPELAAAGQALFAELAAPARALCADEHRARRLVLAIAASAHGHAVFLAEGVLDDLADPLETARREAAVAASALIARYVE